MMNKKYKVLHGVTIVSPCNIFIYKGEFIMLKLFIGLLIVVLLLMISMLIGIFLKLVLLSLKTVLIVLFGMILLSVIASIINGIYKGK